MAVKWSRLPEPIRQESLHVAAVVQRKGPSSINVCQQPVRGGARRGLVFTPMDHRDKLERAKVHFSALGQAMQTLTNRHYDLVKEADTRVWRVVFREDPPAIPRDWSLILGDGLHNLRSSLDALAYALAARNSGQPTDSHARNIQFPICDSHEEFQKRRDSNLRRLSAAAQAAIEIMQPYHVSEWGGGNPLGLLRDLSNVDKHRRLVIVLLNVDVGHVVLAGHGLPTTGQREEMKRGIVSVGTVLASGHFPESVDLDSVQIATGHLGPFYSIDPMPSAGLSRLHQLIQYLPIYVEQAVMKPLEAHLL